jgi:hypothetical protein
VLQEDRADAASLVLVGDRERDLRCVRLVGARVASDPDDALGAVLAQRRDEARTVGEVETRELVELRVGESPLRAEESEVDRACAQPVEVLDEPLPVVRADGADVDRPSVTEDLFGRVLAGIGDRRCVARGRAAVNRRRGSDFAAPGTARVT